MNKKYILLVIVIALAFSFLIYKTYKYKSENTNTIYLLQVGAYKNYDNVLNVTKELDNYILLEENDLYKVFAAVTMSNDVYSKLARYYSENFNSYKKTIRINDNELIDKIEKYDSLLNNVDTKEEVDLIVNEEMKMLKGVFKESI